MTGGERQKAGKAGGSAIAVGVVGVFYGVGELENTKRMSSLFRGKSLSAVFTQNRLFRPECVSAGILMLTYLSTLRSKTGFCLVRPEKCVFCKFPQHQPSPSLRSGEYKEGDFTTSF